jgi:hypothetical protein
MESIINTIVSIIFISTFICVFFFTYGKEVEKQIVKEQSEYIASSLMDDAKTFIPDNMIKNIINQIQMPDMKESDQQVENNNKEIQQYAIKVIGISSLIGIIIAYFLSYIYNIKFIDVIKNNLVILLFIAVTEYIFLTYIIKNFIIADPNFVRNKMLRVLKEKFNL